MMKKLVCILWFKALRLSLKYELKSFGANAGFGMARVLAKTKA